MPGYEAFAGALARIAVDTGDRRVSRLVEDLRAPLRVGVRGRSGAGCRTVVRALRAAGLDAADHPATSDLDVHVLVETLRSEDRVELAESPRPCVAVLNKADLSGFGGAGPMAAAAARCGRIEGQTGVPTLPLVGLLAVAVADEVLDDAVLEALRVLAAEPADLRSVDGFVGLPHRLSGQMRARLLAGLDLFGIARAIALVRGGADRSAVIAGLRRASGLDSLLAAIERTAAPVHYRRILNTIGPLAEISTGLGGDRVAGLLAGDDVVLARMAAAVDVVPARVMVGDTAGDYLNQAVFWQRYAQGPVSALHRACGSDIVRGSLRLWSRSGGVQEPAR